MNGTHTRLAVLLALSALALVACGGGSSDALTGPGPDLATLDKAGPSTSAGDGVCDGTGSGDGTCDGTCDGGGPNGQGNGNGNGYGPGDGTCDGTAQGNGPGDGTCDGSGDGTCNATSPEGLEAILVEALQEEYKAEWTYRRVLADLGDVAPFSIIAESEARHVDAILHLFARREWAAPESVWRLDNVATFGTLAAACAGGVAVENEDGALYEQFLSRDDLPQDAVNVFTNLQAVSLNNHLPAFQSCQ
jgi:hypothetical protein